MPARAAGRCSSHSLKALGVGVYSAAIRKGELSGDAYAEMIASTTLLNRIGADLTKDQAVHAITDVTGFGLLGHGLEVARGSKLTLVIEASRVPLLNEAESLARNGFVTGASKRKLGELRHRRLFSPPACQTGSVISSPIRRRQAVS